MSYKNLNVATARREIKSINDARAKLVDRIQTVALYACLHAHQHGDVTLAIELCKSVGKGMKHESLRLWFEKFGPMTPKKESILTYSKGKVLSGAELDAMMEAAEGMLWCDFETEKKAEAFSFEALLSQLLRKVDKAEDFEPSAEDRELLSMLRKRAEKKPGEEKAGEA